MRLLATAFATANDTQQAQMLDEFARELFVRCGGRQRPDARMCEGYESQVCNIAAQLTADGKTLIRDLNAFLVKIQEKALEARMWITCTFCNKKTRLKP